MFELWSSLLAGLGTLFGAAAVLAARPRHQTLAFFMGLASAVMVAVVCADLVPTAMLFGGLNLTVGGVLAGIIVVAVMDLRLGAVLGASRSGYLKAGVLVTLGIALHDFPEGLAIAAGFAAKHNLGLLMAVAIGMHNVPEGMATAAPLRAAGVSPVRILLVNAALSLVTPLGTLAGILITKTTVHSISVLSAAAAGAMLYIVVFELLPRSLSEGASSALRGMAAGLLLFGVLCLFL
ncbi:ZIP family metal transporter [Desulforudis sp. 1088]|uniref:ZIP family metal transporter n=1 Tax=unclassified Candidatus Desulforudis TaxID=2635950 RepID=UPI0034718F5C